jgi:hypothetical protein
MHHFPRLGSTKPFQVQTERNKTPQVGILDEQEGDLPNVSLEILLVCDVNEVDL